ncbi:MAG TPA: cupin domain-containing protein [Solirubrobacterales bacterium]|nr:cupin domain-containing protein [Solirubrobacterales bacterium]
MSSTPAAGRPPATDAGTLPNLRFSFADAHPRRERGGWAREVTERELPVATELAGVDMRLEPGAVRELHWHEQAEWAFMIAGAARITAVDQEGRAFVDEVGPEDLWYFPAAIPHSIQALAPGCEFLLVFDDGGFSENATFLLCDWLAHTPREALAKGFGLAPAELGELPDGERYIFAAEPPAPLDPAWAGGPDGRGPGFSYRLSACEPRRMPGGSVKVVDSAAFPAATTVAAALVEIEPGGIREPHWHPNADEWQYHLAGEARMTVFGAAGKARTFELARGDVGYVPFAMGHFLENTGAGTLRFLEIFRSDRFAELSLARWLAQTPPDLVAAHLGEAGRRLNGELTDEKRPVRPRQGPR